MTGSGLDRKTMGRVLRPTYNRVMTKTNRLTRALASILAVALIHTSVPTRAFAQVVSVGAVGAPVGGASAASVNAIPTANAATLSLPTPGAALTGTFAAPSAGPAINSFSPVAAAPALAPSALAVQALGTPAAAEQARAQAAPIALTPAAITPAAVKGDSDPNSLSSFAAEPAKVAAKSGLVSAASSRAASIVAGVRAAFGGKSVQNVPNAPEALVAGKTSAAHATDLEPSDDAARPQVRPASNEPPAPPSDNGGGNDQGPNAPKGKGWFGLGAIVAGMIGGMLVMQLGLEAQGAAMAQLTEDAFGDFSILAQVAIFSSIGSMVGQQLSKIFSAKFGLTRTFYGAHVLRAASLATMVFLLGTGHMALPLMFVFYALNGVVTGVAATAEGTLRKFLLQQQGVSQQKFRTWWQLLAESVAVPAPILLGSLVVSLGASWITALYPATIVAGLLIFLMFKIIPWKAAARIENQVSQAGAAAQAPAQPADPDAPKQGAWQKFKATLGRIFNDMEEGKNFVFTNAVLKFSLIAATVFDLMNVLIYRLITPGYGKLVAGSAGMAAVQGNLVGMFSLGGLLLAAFFLIMERRDKKANEGKTAEQLAASERSSMLRWALLGIPALALLGVMAFNIALPLAPVVLLGTNWMPGTMLGLMLIPFGFFQVAASIKLNSYFQERLPADAGRVQQSIAFSGSAMTALSIVLMLALKPLFGDITAFNPFPYLAAALIPVGALLFFMQRKLASATKPEALHIAAPSAKPAGGFAGMLLGVIAAALLLSFLPMIPAAAAWIGSIGILGKFLLHLGVALTLPAAGWVADRRIRARSKQ